MSIDHHELLKTRNLCFRTNVNHYVRTNRAKIEKISNSRAIQLEFLHSLVSAIRCEANKSNWQREERPICSRAFKMLRDLLRRARGLAQHVEAANAREKVRARMHNQSWAWASEKSLTRPSFFCICEKSWKNEATDLAVSQLRGSTIAIITAHVPGQHMWASAGPGPSSSSPKQWKSDGRVKIYNFVSARSPLTKFKKKKL